MTTPQRVLYVNGVCLIVAGTWHAGVVLAGHFGRVGPLAGALGPGAPHAALGIIEAFSV